MYKTTKKIFFPLLAFLMMISLGFVNKAEASSNENFNFTTEISPSIIPEITVQAPQPRVSTQLVNGSYENYLYTKSLQVKKNGSFGYDLRLWSIDTNGKINITIQRKSLGNFVDVQTYTYQSGGTTAARQTLHNLKAGEYRLKFSRTNSQYTSVNGHLESY